jgi:hypothetical protein
MRTTIYSVQIIVQGQVQNFISAGKTDRGGMMVQFTTSLVRAHTEVIRRLLIIITQPRMLNLVKHTISICTRLTEKVRK